jgi:hypothetical protein
MLARIHCYRNCEAKQYTDSFCQSVGENDMSKQRLKHPNAHKHGVFSATAILPGEDEREFEDLHAALIEEWSPHGATEEDAVLSIAKAVWRKRRLQRFLEVQIKRNTVDPDHPSYSERNALMALLTHLRSVPESVPFTEYAPWYLRLERFEYLKEKCPRKRFQSNSSWLDAIRNEIETLLKRANIAPEVEQIESLYNAATSLSGDLFKQELALDERLDAMIDRAVKRLVQAKAMKQMLGPKQISDKGRPSD